MCNTNLIIIRALQQNNTLNHAFYLDLVILKTFLITFFIYQNKSSPSLRGLCALVSALNCLVVNDNDRKYKHLSNVVFLFAKFGQIFAKQSMWKMIFIHFFRNYIAFISVKAL